jgi:hypothetical protein
MRTRTTRDLPARLEGMRQRFERWRRTRERRSHIPKPLWASAVKAAGKYGLHRTAQALRLDYYALKKRVEEEETASRNVSRAKVAPGRVPTRRAGVGGVSTGGQDGPAAATFLELAPPVSGGVCECLLELEDPGGAKMRVHLKGVEAPDLAALSRSFWGIDA